jgi:hypothetical protein
MFRKGERSLEKKTMYNKTILFPKEKGNAALDLYIPITSEGKIP